MDRGLIVLDGSTFFVSEPSGDVEGEGASGFFHDDVRHLSLWKVSVDGGPIRVLTSRTVEYYQARIFGTLSGTRLGENPSLSIRRDRIVADGVDEDITLENHSEEERRVSVEVRFGSDFADLFEVKGEEDPRGTTSVERSGREVTLWYDRDGYRRGTRIVFEEPAEVADDHADFSVRLPARAWWKTHIEILPLVDEEARRPRLRCDLPGKLEPKLPLPFDEWIADSPRIETDFDVLEHTYQQSIVDLAALRFRPLEEIRWALPAAGLPWFMALFGRDALITDYQSLPFQGRLAAATLEALAEYQATKDDPFRDAEPGKILHELRRGVLASIGEVPHSPYYGTHDATPLFLVLLDEYERWTGDGDLVGRLEPAARAALEWIEGPGDPDGDGYLEYRRRSPKGLDNQCWKDSDNSMAFADGSLAEPPIAACEVQGYAYDARIRAARLAREFWEDKELAKRLEQDAAALKERFNRDFWVDGRGHFALALDGKKRQVDSMTSNVGHLLWSGIVDDDYAEESVRRLMAADMFSGWGVRTMSTDDGAYNPIEYHNGTVWPHDTSIVAEGMRRYGFREEASTLALALIQAAEPFAYRLPEVFAGYPREEGVEPVEYPTASRPQAWAAGAPLLALRTLLGLDVEKGKLRASPHVPEEIGGLRILGVQVRSGRADVP